MVTFVISPSYPQTGAVIASGAAVLSQKLGLAVENFSSQPGPDGDFLDSLPRRVATVQAMLKHPGPAIGWAARGGLGAYEVALALDKTLCRSRPRFLKSVLGYSDITALHLLWRKHRLGPTFLGPHTGGLASGRDPFSLQAFRLLLAPGPVEVSLKGRWLGDVGHLPPKAELLGGNLTVLASTLGGPLWEDQPKQFVLCLEDIDEEPYQLDRSLMALRGAGVLKRAVAVIWGDFTGCEKPSGKFGPDFEDVFRHRILSLGVPVFATSHFGHGAHQGLLPLGVKVAMSGTKTGLVLKMGGGSRTISQNL